MTSLDSVPAARILAEIERRGTRRKLYSQYDDIYDPAQPNRPGAYPWQVEFHNAGATHAERLLMAANRVGKTSCAAAELACHMTGDYPHWWQGRRWERPVHWWAGGVSTEATRDVIQTALLGEDGNHGTGWLPGERLEDVTFRQAGVTRVADRIRVKHRSGGLSSVQLKTYEQERKAWQGTSKDGIWLDEECKQDIYTEALTRILDKKGILLMTFTPLEGPTDVVAHFLDAKEGSGIYVKNVGWNDAPHLDAKEKERLLNSYPEHERATRTTGTPLMGSGAVFPVLDEQIMCEPIQIPKWWGRVNGIDFGIDHPGAGAFCAHDRDTDTFYVYDCYKAPGHTSIYHAGAMKKHGVWIPNAWPHDGLERDKGSGQTLRDQYRQHGLYMLPTHAAYHDERGNHVEPGLVEMLEYMRLGKFKVFKTLTQWFEEKRMYHRKDGKVVKERDDILSATRYAFVMRRVARTEPSDVASPPRQQQPIAGPRRWRRNS